MKTPHVTDLSKEKDTGETNDGDCIKETEMGNWIFHRAVINPGQIPVGISLTQ